MTDMYRASTALFYRFRLSYQFSEIATRDENARVPWALLRLETGRYIEEKYLPPPKKEVILQQNHKIVKDHAYALLHHWARRQAAGKKSLRFKKEVESAPRRMRSGRVVDGSEEEDVQRQHDDEDEEAENGPAGGNSINGEIGVSEQPKNSRWILTFLYSLSLAMAEDMAELKTNLKVSQTREVRLPVVVVLVVAVVLWILRTTKQTK
jgi:hypothetical protein